MIRHGYSTYINHCCRCEICRAANAAYIREYRARARARAVTLGGRRLLSSITHGISGYDRGCRCETCREARRVYEAARKGAA